MGLEEASLLSASDRFNRMLIGIEFKLTLILESPAATTTAQFSYGNCVTKGTEEKGLCIHIRDCPFLYEILNISEPTPAQRQLLSDSQCGLDNRPQSGLVQRILVCCPDSKRTAQGSATGGGGSTINNRFSDEPEPGNVLPSIGKCGVFFANRIIGGTKTQLSEFPWMALLQYKKSEYHPLLP